MTFWEVLSFEVKLSPYELENLENWLAYLMEEILLIFNNVTKSSNLANSTMLMLEFLVLCL